MLPARGGPMRAKKLIHSVAILLLSLVWGEIALRIAGRTTWTATRRVHAVPTLYEADAELGWHLRVGRFERSVGGKNPHHVTLWPGGRRATRPSEPFSGTKRGDVVFVGCSFTLGFGLDDEVTLPWLVQDTLPEIDVENHATGGFGTLQSLLMLKRILKQREDRGPLTVIYGLNGFHEERNVGEPGYVRDMARISRHGTVAMPYVEWDAGQGTLRPGWARFPRLPFVEFSALAAFADELGLRLAGIRRTAQRTLVTQKLILAMRDSAAAAGARTIVLLERLGDAATRSYVSFLRAQRVEFIDGVHPGQDDPAWQLDGDEHPNARMTKYWAAKVVDVLAKK